MTRDQLAKLEKSINSMENTIRNMREMNARSTARLEIHQQRIAQWKSERGVS